MADARQDPKLGPIFAQIDAEKRIAAAARAVVEQYDEDALAHSREEWERLVFLRICDLRSVVEAADCARVEEKDGTEDDGRGAPPPGGDRASDRGRGSPDGISPDGAEAPAGEVQRTAVADTHSSPVLPKKGGAP